MLESMALNKPLKVRYLSCGVEPFTIGQLNFLLRYWNSGEVDRVDKMGTHKTMRAASVYQNEHCFVCHSGLELNAVGSFSASYSIPRQLREIFSDHILNCQLIEYLFTNLSVQIIGYQCIDLWFVSFGAMFCMPRFIFPSTVKT
jgi:hypothetical protein